MADAGSTRKSSGRRAFLAETAGGVAVLAAAPVGALHAMTASDAVSSALSRTGSPHSPNEALRVGLVGCGSRGGQLLAWTRKLSATMPVTVTAVADLLESRRQQTAERTRQWTGRAVASCPSAAALFERADVDAVLIASADFQHAWHAAQAVLAGKDAYVEKPFGCDFQEVSRAAELIRRSDRIVVPGTQARGAEKYAAATRFLREGRLGRVTYVEIAEPAFGQRWLNPNPSRPITERDLDWSEFLCGLPAETPFNPRAVTDFRLYWPFSSGPFCQWMSHRIDLVNLLLGSLPTAAASLGGVYLWKDGRTNPDTVDALLEYPDGVLCRYHMRTGNGANGRALTVYGTLGTLDVEEGVAFGNGGGGAVSTPIDPAGRVFPIDSSRLLADRKAGGVRLEQGGGVDWLGHFFDCCRTRATPIAGVDDAYGHAVATILAHQSYRTGRRMHYDADARRMFPAG
jgi:predicted dehydrogenase